MQVDRGYRAAVAVLMTLGLVVALTGCETFYLHGPYELGFDGRNLQVATCVARDVESVLVDEYVLVDGGQQSRRIWDALGDISIVSGDSLVVGGDNPGLITTTNEPPRLEHGYEYYVQFNEEEGVVSSARFSIPSEGLGKGEWLTSHGDVRTTACE